MNETIKTKICTQCKNEQKLSCFHKNKAAKDGYRSQCKQCVRKYYTEKPMVTKEYYANNRGQRRKMGSDFKKRMERNEHF